jgi:hypothetical protein
VRLIKGAYWDYETVLAQQRRWPLRVFEHKPETDANYERLARRMLEHEAHIRCAFGTHSIRTMAACMTLAEKAGVPQRNYEFQMLYGMAEPIKSTLMKMGYRVRDYCPIGEILPGMSYLVRRLLENTSNEGFLRATFTERMSPQELLRDPEAMLGARTPRPQGDEGQTPHSENSSPAGASNDQGDLRTLSKRAAHGFHNRCASPSHGQRAGQSALRVGAKASSGHRRPRGLD